MGSRVGVGGGKFVRGTGWRGGGVLNLCIAVVVLVGEGEEQGGLVTAVCIARSTTYPLGLFEFRLDLVNLIDSNKKKYY